MTCFSFVWNRIQVLRWAIFLFCVPVYQEFDHLLEEQSPIESYIEWLDSMVDRCVVKVGKEEWVTDVHYELYSGNTFLEKVKIITKKKKELVMSRNKAVVGKISPVFVESCSHSRFCLILLLFILFQKMVFRNEQGWGFQSNQYFRDMERWIQSQYHPNDKVQRKT